jgi:ATP-dependent Lhr-like helicase
MSDAAACLDSEVVSAVYGRFSSLRPPQEAAIKPLLEGRNIILSAGTASGKTEAAIAPLLHIHWRKAVETDSVLILYISPTKALANDLEKRLSVLVEPLGMRTGIRHGDRDDLKRRSGCHILITTPESLEVLMLRKDKYLQTIEAVILDEIHLLYNTQRGLQLALLLKRLNEIRGKQLQKAALSATIGSLSHIREFFFQSGEDVELLSFPAARRVDAVIRAVPDEEGFAKLIKSFLTGPNPLKLLLFADSRKKCERLAAMLSVQESLHDLVYTHYSSLSTEVRVKTEAEFSALPHALCIATSTLELGIDIGDIDATILWGAPSNVESYLQRIGRGNRRTGETKVLCLIPDDISNRLLEALKFLVLYQAASKGELPSRPPFEIYGAEAQQFLSFIACRDYDYTTARELHELVSAQGYGDRETVESILEALSEKGFLKKHDFKRSYGGDEGLHDLVRHRMIYGNFPLASRSLLIFHGRQQLGEVPAINGLVIKTDDIVNFSGKRWRVEKVTYDEIHLEPAAKGKKGKDFIYTSPGQGFDAFLSNRMWQWLAGDSELPEMLFTGSLLKALRPFVNALRTRLTASSIPYIKYKDNYLYFTFGGYLVNRALGIFTDQERFKATDMTLRASIPIQWETIPARPSDFQGIYDSLIEYSQQSIFQSMLPAELQKREFLQEWLRNDSIAEVLQRLSGAQPVELLEELAMELCDE